jgi:hypothetical protein
LLSASSPASAAGELDLPGCHATTLPRNDDGFSAAARLPFAVNFYGTSYDSIFVNNNGNVTFDSGLSEYVPFDLKSTNRVIIAPFFADVDTRPADGGTVSYGETTYDGRPAFCALWDGVGYYNQQTDRRNTFELLLVRRESGIGDFDIVFRYAAVAFELGSASTNVPARVGFSNGAPANSVELAGSAVAGAFLDGGPVSLTAGSINSGQAGTWIFRVLSGTPGGNDPRNVPAGLDRSTPWWTWPDNDSDGLPDHWETAGVWSGDTFVNLPAMGATPSQRDAFVFVDVVEGERWNDRIEAMLRESFLASPLGVHLHIIKGGLTIPRASVPQPVTATGVGGNRFFTQMVRLDFAATGLGGSPGSVPALAKYVCACPDHEAGLGVGGQANGFKADHLVLTVNEPVWLAAVARVTGLEFADTEFVRDRVNAISTMHELGHLYGLKHHGTTDYFGPNNDQAADPAYHSIMSYSYNVFGVPQPPQDFVSIVPRMDYSREALPVNLDWQFGGGFGALSLIFGQHADRGDFYSSVAEISGGIGEAPVEAGIDELLADPAARETIRAAGNDINQATDRVKPTAKLSVRAGKVTGRGRRATARLTVRFSVADNLTPKRALRIKCKLDHGFFKPCRPGLRYHRVKRGRHTFTVRITDGGGNRRTAVRLVRAK